MNRYLVTGGCGFIGSHLTEGLLRDGAHVTVLDNLSTGHRAHLPARANLKVGDITDHATLVEAIAACDGIFHLAAIASVPKCTEEWRASHGVNLSASIDLFEIASRRNLPVVYASSSAVYGNVDTAPIEEHVTKQPISAYGADKLGMELHAFAGAKTHGLRSFGLRFFNIYGPRQDPHSPYSGVIAIFMKHALECQPVVVHGNGAQVRDFVFVADAVASLQCAMELIRQESSAAAYVANVCTGRPTSIKELAEVITGRLCPGLEVRFGPARSGDIATSVGDPLQLEKMLGVRPTTTLADGLAAMMAYQQRVFPRLI